MGPSIPKPHVSGKVQVIEGVVLAGATVAILHYLHITAGNMGP